MATIKPTVGRKIWYWPGDNIHINQAVNHDGTRQPIDATIVCVNHDGTINIAGWDSDGVPYRERYVPLVQEGENPSPINDDLGYCSWMPYQVGQAKAAVVQPNANT